MKSAKPIVQAISGGRRDGADASLRATIAVQAAATPAAIAAASVCALIRR